MPSACISNVFMQTCVYQQRFHADMCVSATFSCRHVCIRHLVTYCCNSIVPIEEHPSKGVGSCLHHRAAHTSNQCKQEAENNEGGTRNPLQCSVCESRGWGRVWVEEVGFYGGSKWCVCVCGGGGEDIRKQDTTSSKKKNSSKEGELDPQSRKLKKSPLTQHFCAKRLLKTYIVSKDGRGDDHT